MNPTETVQADQRACAEHDWAGLRTLLDERLEFTGPRVRTHRADEFLAAMQNFGCAFEHRVHHILVGDGGVAVLLDCVFKAPCAATVRRSEWSQVSGGRIKKIQPLFDPAKMPGMPPAQAVARPLGLRTSDSTNFPMNRRFRLCFLGYTILSMILGPLWYRALFKDTRHAYGIYDRADPVIPLGFLSVAIQGAILAAMFPRWLEARAPDASGLKFARLMGLFMFTLSTLAAAAKTGVRGLLSFVVMQAAFHAIQFLGTGLIFGRVHRDAVPASAG